VENFRIYFGGTFDPPHIAHNEILLDLLDSNEASYVHLVPTSINPLKEINPLFNAEDRKKFISSWLKSFNSSEDKKNKKLILENYEIDKSQECFTSDTISYFLQHKYSKNDKWILAMGSDSARSFHLWKGFQDLYSLLHEIWVYPRVGDDFNIENIKPEIRDKFKLRQKKITKISSTEIRQVLTSKKSYQFVKNNTLAEVYEKIINN